MSRGLTEGHGWFRRFLAGAKNELHKLRRSLSIYAITTPASKPGNVQEDVAGAPAAGVAWPVMPEHHDGCAFLVADAFFAIYDPATREATMLDNLLEPHPAQIPLREGRDLFLPAPLSQISYGVVIRGSEYGSEGLRKNIFLASQSKKGGGAFAVIAHHRAPNPNANSTIVSDPDSGGSARDGIDSVLRVRGWPQAFIVHYNADSEGFTAPPFPAIPPGEGPYCLMIEASEPGGGTKRGYANMTYGAVDAAMSWDRGGPLTHGVRPWHYLGQSHERRDYVHGALHCDSLFTRHNKAYESPLEILDQYEPDVQPNEGWPVRVWCMVDRDEPHGTPFGRRPYLRRWHVYLPVIEPPACESAQMYNVVNGIPERTYWPGGLPVMTLGQFMSPGNIGVPRPGAAQAPTHVGR